MQLARAVEDAVVGPGLEAGPSLEDNVIGPGLEDATVDSGLEDAVVSYGCTFPKSHQSRSGSQPHVTTF